MAKTDFLAELLDNQVRAKIIRLFCATPAACFTAEEITQRSQIPSAKTTEKELKVLQKLGLVRPTRCAREVKQKSGSSGRKVQVPGWTGNPTNDYFKVLGVFVRDTEPAAEESILGKLKGAGNIKLVVASGFFAAVENNPSRIDLLIVGEKLNERKIASALRSIEAQHGREIAYAAFSTQDFRYRLDIYDRLIRDVLDYPHHVLLDLLKVF